MDDVGAGVLDARYNMTGTYSAWLTKVKGEGAKARWLSSTTKRYFTIDFTSQLFFYAQSESQKTVSHPIRFKDIVSADQLPDAGSKSEHPFGFSILTAERTYELFTHSYQDAELWVSALNAARDIANGKVPGQAPSSTRHSHEFSRPLGVSSLSTSTSDCGGDHRLEDGRAPWEPPPVTTRWTQPAPVQQELAAPPPPPVDPFAALDALEELAGPAPEDSAATPVAPELQGELLKEARARVTGALTSKRSLQEIEAAVAPPPWRPEVEYHVTEVAEDEAPRAPFASSPDVVMADVPLSTVAAFVTGAAPEPAVGAVGMAGIAPPAGIGGIGGIAPPAGMGGIAPPAGFGGFGEEHRALAAALPAPAAALAAPVPNMEMAPSPPENNQESWDDPPVASAPLPPQAPIPPSFGDGNLEAAGDLDDLVGEIMAVTSKEAGSHSLLEHFHCIGCDFQVLVCEDCVWTDEVDYMFFRNNYPNIERLRKCLVRQEDCRAYCCQCSWKSARSVSSLQEVADGLRWRKIA